MPQLFKFLSLLSVNNNREWFNCHKEEFNYLRNLWLADLKLLIGRMAEYDNSLRGVDVKDCVYRIYRDIRFSPNKLPYKTHFGAVIGRGGRKCLLSSYYIHLEPGNKSGIYGGIWCPEPNVLKALRHAIDDNSDEFLEIINNPELKRRFTLVGDKLKNPPKGFDKTNPNIELLKMKEYLLSYEVGDEYMQSDDWISRAAHDFSFMTPFHRFMNFTIEEEI